MNPSTKAQKADQNSQSFEKNVTPSLSLEQLRSTQLIMKNEDPALKEKLKYVMDATQRSSDEAYIALHDSDNDVNRAVNLLLENDIQDQWSTLTKKKKLRSTEKPKEGQQVQPPEMQTIQGENDTRGQRGNSRPPRGNRGRLSNNYSNFDNERAKRGRNILPNNLMNSRGGRGNFRGARQNLRGRTNTTAQKPILAWNNEETDSSKLLDQWDYEEYTGSLAVSHIFTSSTQKPFELKPEEATAILKKALSSDLMLTKEVIPEVLNSPRESPALVINQEQILQEKFPPMKNTNPEKCIDPKSSEQPHIDDLPKNYPSDETLTTVKGKDSTDSSEESRLARIPVKQKPRLPPPFKMSLSAVEMPTQKEEQIDCLGVQFGGLDFSSSSESSPFGKNSSERSPPTPSSPRDGLGQANTMDGNQSSNHSRSGSPFPISGCDSLEPQFPERDSGNQENVLQNSSESQRNSFSTYQVQEESQFGVNNQKVYGYSSLSTSSYAVPYPTFTGPCQKATQSISENKDQDSSIASVNLSTTGYINGTSTTLPSTTPTKANTPSSNTLSKGTVAVTASPGAHQSVNTQQYIMGQGGIPYFQPPLYYEELQMLHHQRLPIPGYFEVGYHPSSPREFSFSDGRLNRTDNTSLVQVSSITSQTSSHGHQQQVLNKTALPPAYAYFYGGSIIPGNFQFGAPVYPVAGSSTSTHAMANTATFGKGASPFHSVIYDPQNVQEQKTKSTQPPTPSPSPDISNIYLKPHSALSKVGNYEKPWFHYAASPPPFNLTTQTSGLGPGGYPQHLFIPTMTPHHNPNLMQQTLHQESGNSERPQIPNQQNKITKTNYTSSMYWNQN